MVTRSFYYGIVMVTIALAGQVTLTGSVFAGNCFSHSEKSASKIMKKAEELFMKADKNSDRALSQLEHKRAGLDKVGVVFKVFDKDRDDSISWDEYSREIKRSHGTKETAA